jgi:homoserine kinase type II
MDTRHDVAAVLAAYPAELQPTQIDDITAGAGFSGARLWRLTAPAGRLCLRRWPPEHPSAERLPHIHAVLRHVAAVGLHVVPVPRVTSRGNSFVEHGGTLWEIAPWLPGTADYHADPRPQRLAAAMQTLARFHAASERFPGLSQRRVPSPALAERLALLRRLRHTELAQLAVAVRGRTPDAIAVRARRLMDLFPQLASPIQSQLEGAGEVPTRLIPCLRDIWHDHVLFRGDEVTGLLDFGSLRNESVAGDLARLLGSLVSDDAERWRQGLAAYQQVRPLDVADVSLIDAFDRSAVLLSGMNWLRWICLEGRRFERMTPVLERLDEALCRAEHMARGGGLSE